LFVQNNESIDLLDSIGIYHAGVSGDTRFDRVLQLPDEDVSFPVIESFKGESALLVAGSTWHPDEKILHDLILNSKLEIKLVIAPHLINTEHISEIQKQFEEYNPILYSKSNIFKSDQK